jgi:hypothetical protein
LFTISVPIHSSPTLFTLYTLLFITVFFINLFLLVAFSFSSVYYFHSLFVSSVCSFFVPSYLLSPFFLPFSLSVIFLFLLFFFIFPSFFLTSCLSLCQMLMTSGSCRLQASKCCVVSLIPPIVERRARSATSPPRVPCVQPDWALLSVTHCSAGLRALISHGTHRVLERRLHGNHCYRTANR